MDNPSNVPDPASETEDSLDCFMDMGRVCGPSCMAYALHPKAPSEALTAQQNHCTLLVSAERAGRFLGGLVTLYRNSQQESARSFMPPPGIPK